MTKEREALRLALGNLLQATRHLGVCPATVDAAEEALAQPEQIKYRRGDWLRCLETDEFCFVSFSGSAQQWVKFPDGDVLIFTNEQVTDLFDKIPKEQWTPDDAAYHPGGLVRTEPDPTPEQLAALGWQSIECPFCGTSGAQAFPKPETDWEGIAADQAMTIALMKSEQEPEIWMTNDERVAFERFNETCEDGECYDVPKPVVHAFIAGALFDFMAWLTSRKERLVLSSADEASPAVGALTEFAKMRDLSLDDAKVQDWNTAPQPAPPKRKLESTTDMLMALADRLGELPDDVDPRAWEHLLVYAPKREWVGLTPADYAAIRPRVPYIAFCDVAAIIEAKLKELNT